MELIKSKEKEEEFIDLVLSNLRPSSNSLSRISEVNRQSLKELINFLSKLKKEDVIDDKQFAELTILACANFIENEVEVRISKSIDEKIMLFFEKL